VVRIRGEAVEKGVREGPLAEFFVKEKTHSEGCRPAKKLKILRIMMMRGAMGDLRKN